MIISLEFRTILQNIGIAGVTRITNQQMNDMIK